MSGALNPSGKYTAVMPFAEVSGERDTYTTKESAYSCTTLTGTILTYSLESQVLHLLLELLACFSVHLEPVLEGNLALHDSLERSLESVDELNRSYFGRQQNRVRSMIRKCLSGMDLRVAKYEGVPAS